jgi:hypothetical protein
MYLPDVQKLNWLTLQGNTVTNPLLTEPERLHAAIQHTESLENLDKASPALATQLIKGFASQIGNFLITATDTSEPAGVRQYIIHFTLRNGLHHISQAGGAQLEAQSPFSSAAFSIAETAAINIDLDQISRAMLQIVTDPGDDIEVRRDAALLHILSTLHQTYQFRQPPPATDEAIKVYRDISP